jgi:hypothetical protein
MGLIVLAPFRWGYLTLKRLDIKPVQVHYFAPGGYEVMHEGLLRVAGGVDFREGAELGVGTEDQVDDGA